MEHDAAPRTPLGTLKTRMREVRRKRGLTAQQLADLMAEHGVKWDRGTVSKLEGGHRQAVSFEEWLTLSYVLNVAPIYMLIPLEDGVPYTVGGEITEVSERVRAWVAGNTPFLRPPGPDADVGPATWTSWMEETPASGGERLLDPRTLEKRVIELVDARVAAALADKEEQP